MKKIIAYLLLTSISFVTFYSSAQAEFFSASVGVPVSYSLNENKDKNKLDGAPSGYLIHLKLPILIGIGYESYEQKIKHENPTLSTSIKQTAEIQFYDIFYQLPIPIINITLGLGYGKSELKTDPQTAAAAGGGGAFPVTVKTTNANLMQYYLQLGYTFGIFDIHASYHMIKTSKKGEMEITAGSPCTGDACTITEKYNPAGSMTAIGFSIGF